MSTIPEELLEQFERGNVLLLIGEGINQGVLPSSQELARELAARCGYPPEEVLSLASVASYYGSLRNCVVVSRLVGWWVGGLVGWWVGVLA